ncbi:amidohydrolase family protein [Novosphingobium terrae]|uniref:amidohydrolase family protein n=1 Tax=Novosphingobium terrae TaxID=2726189 RepID=UPI00197EAFFC|nr:amidohydrolase family protein [Novosphingobium terrae]
MGDTAKRRPGIDYPRIATEEAFLTPELRELYWHFCKNLAETPDTAIAMRPQSAPGSPLAARLLDFDEQRLQDMDANGVAVQILSLTCPGVQIFQPDVASELTRLANDQLADVIARHPTRFRGLAAVAPQAAKDAPAEMERAINKLGLNGFIINSHTNDEYLDDRKYWPVLEAAQALDRPIYIHPRGASKQLAGAYDFGNLLGPLWGFNAEVSTHVVRMIYAGVFDQFPDLKIVIGHMGETIPFYLWRCDFGWELGHKLPEGKFSKAFRRNVAITTSGAADFGTDHAPAEPALRCSIETMGADNIMWAVDYPYQATAPAVTFLDKANISEEDREKIYWRNAARIFRLNLDNVPGTTDHQTTTA